MARQNSLNSQYLYQMSPYLIDAATMRSFTGSIIETLYGQSAALDNRTQAVLSHGERDSPNVTQTRCGPPLPIHIFSGMGNYVTIIEEDLHFEGSLIQVTDGFFTLPNTLSGTLLATTDTTIFASYLISNASIDSTPEVTVFVPDNAAFIIQNNQSLSTDTINKLVSAHVVEGFVAYSPLLVEGAMLRTVAGVDLRISAKPDGTILVNGDSRIVQSDIVVGNGVVHVVDKLLFELPTTTPSPSAPPAVFTGAAGWSPLDRSQTGWMGAVGWSAFLGVAVAVGGALVVGR